MKRIAIVAPCILPVPATKGGAVEALITRLIDDNELNKCFEIDLYTVSDENVESKYQLTTIIPVRVKKTHRLLYKLTDKYYRTVKNKSSKRSIDNDIRDLFASRLQQLKQPYDAVVLQNMMSTAVKLVDFCKGKYEFPFYFHMHNDVDIYRTPEYIRELVKNGVQFIAVSSYIKNQILKYAADARVHTLYNGVDLTEYNSAAKHHRGESFIYVGRIIPDKGVKELATAFNMFLDALDSSEKKRFSLEIIGFSGVDKRYEEIVRGISEHNQQISLIGQLSHQDIAKRYDSADVVVIPSMFEEPFGLVALESMAMGKVIIASDSGALPEVLGNAALIVDKNKDFTGNLCEAMKKVSTDERLCDDLARCAYSRARDIKDFDISVYYSNFCKIVSGRKPEGKISVIVPVYNVEAYLPVCLESIITQSYENLEIILVNDGATDSSAAICHEYAAKDARITVISQENKGLSEARNTGLDNATGDYIFFCDSDDSLSKDALERLIDKATDSNSDVVACGIANVWYDDKGAIVQTERFTSPNPGMWSGRQSVIEMMRSNSVCSVAWNKLYKRHLFDNIRFTAGVLHEDEAVTYKLLYRAKLVSFIPDLLYNYRQRSGSIMQGDLSDRYEYGIRAFADRRRYFEQLGENELAQHSQVSLLQQIKYYYRNVCNEDIKEELKRAYSRELHDGGAPDVIGVKKKLALIIWRYIKY